jgi:hypothetical protein
MPRHEDARMTGRSRDYAEAFPDALWEGERRFLSARRGQAVAGERPPADTVGVALSGGGIRSATFCLGVFQALAGHQLLRKVDYLSTVSGGGYFGAFLGRLFTRPGIRSSADAEELLSPAGDRVSPTSASGAEGRRLPDVLRWLRENGRYLSPNGAGDLLVGGAVMLRNWVAVHVVLASFVLLVFLLLQLLRAQVLAGLEAQYAGWAAGAARRGIWWSPFIAVPLLPMLLIAIPAGWAYWLVGSMRWLVTKQPRPAWYENPLVGVSLVFVVSLWVIGRGRPEGAPIGVSVVWAALGWGLLVEGLLTLVAWGMAAGRARLATKNFGVSAAQTADEGFWAAEQRNVLSRWLKGGLVFTGAALVAGIVDSVGQTLYVMATRPGSNVFPGLGALLTVLGGAMSFARPLAVMLGGKANGKRPRLPVSIIAALAAIALVVVILVSADVLSHGTAWLFCTPERAPLLSWETPGRAATCTRPDRDARTLTTVAIVMLVASLVYGRTWPFLNNSSLHAIYSARLTRAYLGASNPARVSAVGEAQSITRVVPDDNIFPQEYWRGPHDPASAPGAAPEAPADAAPCTKGAPIHLINVTINETVDGRSQIQQQDRKGTGLAIGPCAFSVGVRHHAMFASHRARMTGGRPGAVTVAPARPDTYRVFASLARGSWTGAEELTIGQWVGISGAAFSTGLGSRTSLGLSILCGLANVRLGYWWKSGVEPPLDGQFQGGWRRIVRALFPLQDFLIAEFLSRFSGTARTRWYLSDGGHFENMGGYELIRRRLPRMVIVDAEADPEYRFEGLANLVRKARLDFGAEIHFLTAAELDTTLAESHRWLFGTLEELRRGQWAQEPVVDPETGRPRVGLDDPVDQTRYSRAHAALATVTWADEADVAWLVYLKPTLTGDEPPDVSQYHRAHPPFPQETTGDQFFDEAQWESYRMLGFVIADAVFAPAPPRAMATEAATLPRRPTPREMIFEA